MSERGTKPTETGRRVIAAAKRILGEYRLEDQPPMDPAKWSEGVLREYHRPPIVIPASAPVGEPATNPPKYDYLKAITEGGKAHE